MVSRPVVTLCRALSSKTEYKHTLQSVNSRGQHKSHVNTATNCVSRRLVLGTDGDIIHPPCDEDRGRWGGVGKVLVSHSKGKTSGPAG